MKTFLLLHNSRKFVYGSNLQKINVFFIVDPITSYGFYMKLHIVYMKIYQIISIFLKYYLFLNMYI